MKVFIHFNDRSVSVDIDYLPRPGDIIRADWAHLDRSAKGKLTVERSELVTYQDGDTLKCRGMVFCREYDENWDQ